MNANRFNPLGKRIVQTPAMRYIQDGLVAMWDGVENAGWGKHDANATMWIDLANVFDGMDLPIGSHIIEDQCVRCDTSTQMRVARPSGAFNALKDVYTCEMAFALSSSVTPNQSSSIFGLGVGNMLLGVQANRPDLFNGGWSNSYGGVGQTKTEQSSYIYASTVGLTDFKGYRGVYSVTCDILNQKSERRLNTAVVATNNSAALVGDNTSDYVGFAINGTGRSVSYGVGIGQGTRYYNLRIYKRALTAEEIAHNYAVDKERFGL